jgi:hypothetical protein
MNCANHPQAASTAFCRTCGKALCDECKRDVRGVIYCEDCIVARLGDTLPPAGAAVPGAAVPLPNTPNPALAAILGAIPFGIGAVYNGQYGKAFAHLLTFAFLVLAIEHAGGAEPLFGFMMAFFVFYQIFDAYRTAKAKQLGLPTPDPLGIYSALGVHESTARPSAAAAASAEAAPAGPRVPVAAIVLIGLGVLFFLSNMGMFHMRWVARAWPLILIFFGVRLLMRNRQGAS